MAACVLYPAIAYSIQNIMMSAGVKREEAIASISRALQARLCGFRISQRRHLISWSKRAFCPASKQAASSMAIRATGQSQHTASMREKQLHTDATARTGGMEELCEVTRGGLCSTMRAAGSPLLCLCLACCVFLLLHVCDLLLFCFVYD